MNPTFYCNTEAIVITYKNFEGYVLNSKILSLNKFSVFGPTFVPVLSDLLTFLPTFRPLLSVFVSLLPFYPFFLSGCGQTGQ